MLANRRVVAALVLLVTLLGLGLRLYKLSSQSLWTDEIYSIETSRVPLDHISQASAETNNCLPTYFLLLRAVAGAGNENIETRARLISVIAGTLTIPLFMAVVYFWRRRTGAALIAGLLLAINPLHIWYSQETRAYGLMLFFGIAAVLCFEIARERRRFGWWAGYVAASLIAVALHRTSIIFPAVCSLWHAWDLRRSPKAIWLIHAGVLAAAVLVLTPKSYPPAPEDGRHSSVLELVYTAMTYVGGYSFGPSLNEIQSYGPLTAVSRHREETAAAGAVLLLIALIYAGDLRRLYTSKGLALFLLDLAMVSGYAAVSGFPYNIRYTLPALVGFIALAADLKAGETRSYLTCAGFAGLIAISLWADWQWYYFPIYRKEDSRAVAKWLIDHEGSIKSWTVVPGYSTEPIRWYLDALGHPELNSENLASKEGRTTSFPPYPDALILGRRDHMIRPDELTAEYLSSSAPETKPVVFSGFNIFTRHPVQ